MDTSLPMDSRQAILGILYDMGETNALKKTFDLFEEDHLNYRVLVMGASAINALKAGYKSEKLLYLQKDCATSLDIPANHWNREDAIDEENLANIVETIKTFAPKTILTAMVSKAQWQICDKMVQEGITRVFAYYDAVVCKAKYNPCKPTIDRFINT